MWRDSTCLQMSVFSADSLPQTEQHHFPFSDLYIIDRTCSSTALGTPKQNVQSIYSFQLFILSNVIFVLQSQSQFFKNNVNQSHMFHVYMLSESIFGF